ncbi:MAG: NYN domain-containing protein [Anaerolineae bacterium]|nr:NYN domain-containing protein [Anaerolineae bacterium]MDW8172955.1 NYN domain-containing protein [Anaerolineae bacterium]
MAAYLIVDVDDLIQRFKARGMSVDLQELSVGLRGGAALAAGVPNASLLRAIAVADWSKYAGAVPDPQTVFRATGYDLCEAKSREHLHDIIHLTYFAYDPDPIDELILATTSRDLLPLVRRIKTTRASRIRLWGAEDVLVGTEFANEVIFQPLEAVLGIQTKNVSLYIDFENIAISLSEHGFVVNLDTLITSLVAKARSYGQVIKMSAYAPWGQRGALPPLVDHNGREIADEAPTRLLLANIDPVFNLPGKNSADVRIARDVLVDISHSESADVIILASGDRDFNDVLNSVMQRGKTVILWGVRGSMSRQLTNHPSLTIEYIEDFTPLQTHQSLSSAPVNAQAQSAEVFVPSQWSSVVIQFDRLAMLNNTDVLMTSDLIERLVALGVVISRQRGEDLIEQALSLGILQRLNSQGAIMLNGVSPIVEKTRVITEAIRRRVGNTLKVRGWQYVNYGFLLKGLEMERDLMRPGMNIDDQWRSQWIDALVREGVLQRDLVSHRLNPDDLVPVIRLPDGEDEDGLATRPQPSPASSTTPSYGFSPEVAYARANAPTADRLVGDKWLMLTPQQLAEIDPNAAEMTVRIIVSVEQFTSFRNFAWCPLGSLHKRLKPFDINMAFQRAVEYLQANNVVFVGEYQNPQSPYSTKGISVVTTSAYACEVLALRDNVVRLLLHLFDRALPITLARIREEAPGLQQPDLWLSIMEMENVLQPVAGRSGVYSLFRTHHTVKQVAGDPPPSNA